MKRLRSSNDDSRVVFVGGYCGCDVVEVFVFSEVGAVVITVLVLSIVLVISGDVT